MKNKMNQMLKDKLFLVMLVLGLLVVVGAAGIVRMAGGGENRYPDQEGTPDLLAEENREYTAGQSDADRTDAALTEAAQPERALANRENPDTVMTENHETAEEEPTGGASEEVPQTEAVAADSGLDAAKALVLDFTDQSLLSWPVRGNVILDYSMDQTTYFPTLDEYKCNPGMAIQGDVSLPVNAPANARVLEVGTNEEIGNYVKLDLGNDYTAICGQLKEIPVAEGEYLEEGRLLGYIAEPTKYYSIEGANLYFELRHGNEPVDPLDYLD